MIVAVPSKILSTSRSFAPCPLSHRFPFFHENVETSPTAWGCSRSSPLRLRMSLWWFDVGWSRCPSDPDGCPLEWAKKGGGTASAWPRAGLVLSKRN